MQPTCAMFLGSLILLTAQARAETIYECTYADGRTTKGSAPCLPGMVTMRASHVEAPPAPPQPATGTTAQIIEVTDTQAAAFVMMVKLAGYACTSLDAARPCLWGCDYTIICNDFKYKYNITDKGGRWVVEVD